MSYQCLAVVRSFVIGLGCWTIATGAMLPTMSSAAPLATKINNRSTVADYFLQMPAQYLQDPTHDRITPRQRQQLLAAAKKEALGDVYDLSNGYLALSRGGDTCNRYTIAIFKRPNSSPLVARNISCTVGDSLVILDPARNWQEVTSQVLAADLSPSPDLAYMVEIVLPRVGKTIEVARFDENNRRTILGRYRFNGQRFVKN
jgi:hypothetical protein